MTDSSWRCRFPGTENFFNTLIDTLQNDFSFLSHSLEPLRISAATREAAGQALLLSSKSKVRKDAFTSRQKSYY